MRKATVGSGSRGVFRCGIVLAVAVLGGVAFATEIAYLNESGVTDLTQGTAWSGGVAPGADDVAVFDGATPELLTLGETTTWAGLMRTNVVNEMTLQAPADGTLTLGAEGLRVYSENESFYRLYLDVDVTLPENQTWTWGKNKSVMLLRAVSGPGAITTDLTLNNAGNPGGAIVFKGPMRTAISTTNGLTFSVQANGSMDPAPSVAYGSNLILIPGTNGGTFAFADLFPGHTVTNRGKLNFGPKDDDKQYVDWINTITLSAEDKIPGPNSSTADRAAGHIHVRDTHVVSDGADVTGNVWFDLRSGSWTQKSGDTAFTYGAIVGRGSAYFYGSKDQLLSLEGGTFNSRRMVVGLGNGDTYPAEFRVTDGSWASALPDAGAGNWWAGGLALAPKSYSGESPSDSSDWASGRLEISGGSVRTPAVLFGNNYEGQADAHSGAHVRLSGGRLEVGEGGLRTASHWSSTTEGQYWFDSSWYDVVLSGGTLGFYRPNTRSPADMRLSNRDGGVSVEVADGVTDVAITGSLYGAGGLRKTGAGALKLLGANDYTGRTDVVEGRLVYGDQFDEAVWTGDACGALAEGAAVNTWTTASVMNSAKSWNFAHVTTIVNTSGTTPPTFARKVMNGHDALAFNGTNTAFLTGNAEQPISDKSAFTVSMVIQTVPGFVGNASSNVYAATQIFGTSIGDSWVTTGDCNILYGLAIDDQGHVGCGVFGGQKKIGEEIVKMQDENLWATNQVVNDGKPHVITWSWRWYSKHTLRVDDQVYTLASPSNVVRNTYKTRIVLGVGERQQAPVKRFQGYLADLRMTANDIEDDRCKALTRELGIKYGVEAFAGQSLWNEPAAAERAEVPAPTAAWAADTLAQTAGQTVNEWAERSGKGPQGGGVWTFTKELANTILSSANGYAGSTVGPTVSADTLAGHKMVSFNGTNACLALTGSKATPVGNQDGMTVAMVVRFRTYGTGGSNFSPGDSSPFFGSAFAMGEKNGNWQLMVSGGGRFGAALRSGDSAPLTLRSRERFLNDGDAHVVIVRYPKKNTDDTLTVFLDGAKERTAFKPMYNVLNTRILLGGSEYAGAHYAPVDVAEFRLWGGTVLSDDEVLAVGEELAGTYGLDLAGATRGKAAHGQQMSKDVFVHGGAFFGGAGAHGAMLYPGQTLWGDGSSIGPITLAPGAAAKATTTNVFTFANGVTFMDGAAIAAELAQGETLRPIAVTGNVRLDGTVVVRLSAPQGLRPSGTLLTWTGDLVADANPSFTITGVSATSAKIKVDTANKCLKVVPIGGLVIIAR